MEIDFVSQGDFKRTEKSLRKLSSQAIFAVLDKYGKIGAKALASATPYESGETAAAWSYKIRRSPYSYTIEWTNSHIVDGVSVALILQYGHGTGTGGYVDGVDYINPAMRKVFNDMTIDVWREVTKA